MPENTPNSATTAAVARQDEQFTQAALRVDAPILESIMSDDYIFIGGEGQITDKAGHIAALKSGDRKYTSLKSSDVRVRTYGDTAVLTGRVTAEASVNGQDISGQYLVTRVYVNQGGRWEIVSAQATALAQ
jgi:ketosteroid isomerase-like protein